MSRRLNWEGATRRDVAHTRGVERLEPIRREKGPTNAQRKYLKALAQKAGEPTPMPVTRTDASAAIDRLKRTLDHRV